MKGFGPGTCPLHPMLGQCEGHLGHWCLEMTTRFELTSQVVEQPCATSPDGPGRSEEGGPPPSGPTARGVIETGRMAAWDQHPDARLVRPKQDPARAIGHSLTRGHGRYPGPDISAFTGPRAPRPGPTFPWGALPAPCQAAHHREIASAPSPCLPSSLLAALWT